jgi:hypothetical protein
MANEVFWFDSTDVGAPTLNNAAGTVISVLDACLINGFNSKSVTSIDVTSNVATVTCTSHGFVAVPGKYVLIAGATPTELNGLKQVASVPNVNTFTYAAPGVANGAATGTITAKRAGIGWTKAFTGTNKAVYKSSDPASTGLFLRIDDTNAGVASATDARAVMYETMSDVDTGTNPGPTVSQLSGGQFWNKGANSSTAKTWTLLGDGRIFYLFTQISSFTNQIGMGFGDLISYRAADAYGCVLAGASAAVAGGVAGGCFLLRNNLLSNAPNNSGGFVLSRVAAQTGTSVQAGANFHSMGNSVPGSQGPAYPSPVDNGLVMHRPMYVIESNAAFSSPIRGELPGVIVPLGAIPFSHLEIVSGIVGLTGSAVALAISDANTAGRILFDISNAWRS